MQGKGTEDMKRKTGRQVRRETVVHSGKMKVWTGSIVAALVAALAVFTAMLQIEKKTLADYEKGTVLVAACEIPKGQRITAANCGSCFEERELDQSFIPDTALTSVEQVQDMTAAAAIDKGVLLTSGMFERREDVLSGMQEPVIAGFRAEDIYQVVGGTLRAGDRIHIFRVDEEGEASLIWSDIYVREVFDQAGTSIACEDEVTAAQRINVYLDKKDIAAFYSELEAGSLRVVRKCE